jgi:hypothetical protein
MAQRALSSNCLWKSCEAKRFLRPSRGLAGLGAAFSSERFEARGSCDRALGRKTAERQEKRESQDPFGCDQNGMPESAQLFYCSQSERYALPYDSSGTIRALREKHTWHDPSRVR